MRSLQRQRKMYVDGFAGIKPAIPVSYAALSGQAKQRLSAEAFTYLAGGAGNETTIRAIQTAPEQVKIHPHMLGGVQEVSMNLKWRASTLLHLLHFSSPIHGTTIKFYSQRSR